MVCQQFVRRNSSAVFILASGLSACLIGPALGQVDFGPLYCQWRTTDLQTNIEAVGPVFGQVMADHAVAWAVHPIVSYRRDWQAESTEVDVLYPVFTYDRRGIEYKWQVFQLISASGGTAAEGTNFHRFTVFPIFFAQRSGDPAQRYAALFPVAGTIKYRFFRDEIQFILWPLYVKTVRRQPGQTPDVAQFGTRGGGRIQPAETKIVTYNVIAPVFHVRHGDGLKGWQVWPLIGCERKAVTARTNIWGELETVPGHKSRFFLWPVWLEQICNIGTTNVERHLAFLPLYAQLRSANRDSTSYLWPIGLTITVDRGRRYREVGAPWPLVVFASGEGKTTRRVFPIFSQARSLTAESEWYLWPIYKMNKLHAQPLERERVRILFFLFSDTVERNTQTDVTRRRTALWPLFTASRSYDGTERFQLFSILEPILPNNTGVERNYSPLWTIWRSEKNPSAGTTTRSLLWNLYRAEATTNSRRWSFLFGLFRYESTETQKCLRLLHVPISKKPKPAVQFQPVCPNLITNAARGETDAANP